MNENTPTIESGPEKHPTEREVLNIFESLIQGEFVVERSLEDENGLYLLEVQTVDEAGDKVLYTYMRAGEYQEGSSADTAIAVIFYSDGIPVGGHAIQKYRDGAWVKESE